MTFGDFQWVELLYGFFGSFVGFLLALLTDSHLKKREETSKIKTLLKTIQAECQSIYALIKNNIEHNDDLMLFSTFVWDSITSTDFFPTLLHQEQEKCNFLIAIYSELNVLKELQNNHPTYTQEINSIKIEILSLIENFENTMQSEK